MSKFLTISQVSRLGKEERENINWHRFEDKSNNVDIIVCDL